MQVRLGRNGLVHTFYMSLSSPCSQRLACSSSWVAMHFLLYRRLFRKSKACLIMPLIFRIYEYICWYSVCSVVLRSAAIRHVWDHTEVGDVVWNKNDLTWTISSCGEKKPVKKRNRNNTLHNRSSTIETAHNTKSFYTHPLPFRSIADVRILPKALMLASNMPFHSFPHWGHLPCLHPPLHNCKCDHC